MATEFNFDNQDEEDDSVLAGSGGATSSDPAAASSGGGSGGAASAATPAGARPTTPSGRPNIRQYLNANQGAGQTLASGIQNKTQARAGEVEKGINEGRNQLEASTNPLQAKLGDESQKVIKTAFQDPASILAKQDQLSEFNKLRDKGYNTDIQNVNQQAQQKQQQLQGQVGQLQNTANLAGSEGGRFELLRNTFGQPNYSKGQQRLDQLFLQAQPGAAKTLQAGLQNTAQQQAQGLSGLSNESQAKINALQGLSGQRADEWQNMLMGGSGAGLETDINQRGLDDISASSQQKLDTANQQIAQVPGLRERLKNNKLTDSDLQALGLNRGQKLYDYDLNQAIGQNEKTANLANTADPAEVARYRALKQLSGDTSADIYGGEQNIGGFNPYDVDANLQKTLTDRQKQYELTNVDDILNKVSGPNRVAVPGGMSSAHNYGLLNNWTNNINNQLDTLQKNPSDNYLQDAMNVVGQYNNVSSAGRTGISSVDNLYSQLAAYQKELDKIKGNTIK